MYVMETCYIIRVSEIFLKGKNRSLFQKCLKRNIRAALQANNVEADLVDLRNRILLYTEKDCSFLKDVFGIANYSRAVVVSSDLSAIKEKIKSLWKGSVFKIETTRLDKKFPLSSIEVNKEVGAFLGGKVSMKEYKEWFGIEIDKGQAFLFFEKVSCYGGLPVGSEGNVDVLVQEKNSLKAAWLMLRRGCAVTFFGGEIDASSLEKFSYGIPIRFAKVLNGEVVVVNDTIDALQEYNFPVVFRPLIGYALEEIPI